MVIQAAQIENDSFYFYYHTDSAYSRHMLMKT